MVDGFDYRRGPGNCQGMKNFGFKHVLRRRELTCQAEEINKRSHSEEGTTVLGFGDQFRGC